MYTIARGPSKLVTQRRTGPTQQVESKALELKCRRRREEEEEEEEEEGQEEEEEERTRRRRRKAASPAPKLVFNRINGKRPPLAVQLRPHAEESYTVAHEENVRFVYEAWQQVEEQLDNGRQGERGSGPVQYAEKTPSPDLKDFVPIDLEDWWAQQFLAKIESGS